MTKYKKSLIIKIWSKNFFINSIFTTTYVDVAELPSRTLPENAKLPDREKLQIEKLLKNNILGTMESTEKNLRMLVKIETDLMQMLYADQVLHDKRILSDELARTVFSSFIGIVTIFRGLKENNLRELIKSSEVLPNGLIYFPIVHKIDLFRSLLRFKGILKIYKLDYPKFLPSPETLLQSLTNQEKDSFLAYVLSEIIALPKFSHPAFTLIEELIKKPIINLDNINYLKKVLELFSFDKTDFFTLSDLSILELRLLLDTF